MAEKTKKGRWWKLVLGGVIAVSTGFFLWQAIAAPPVSDTYQTSVISRGNIENTITAVGVLQPLKYVDVGAQVSGQLKNMKVKPGDTVKQGDLLAEIDPAIFSAKVLEAEATLENLKVQLTIKEQQARLAAQQNTRTSGLFKEDAVAAKELEVTDSTLKIAKSEIEVVRSQIRQAEASLQTASANLRYTRIIAPISGTVVSVAAREGQTLNANQQAPIILRIADLETMTVWAQVSEADVTKLRAEGEAFFNILGVPDRRWNGTIRQILPTPEVINNVTLYNALFDVANPDGTLKVQMTAQVFFILEKAEDVLVAPASALQLGQTKGGENGAGGKNGGGRQGDGAGGQQKEKKSTVRVLSQDGSIEERKVTTGIRNQVAAEIRSGLLEGETVITGMAKVTKTGQNGNGLGGKRGGKL